MVSRAIDFLFGEIADERPAAEKISKMPLLIGPGGDFDREIRTTGILVESACNFEPIDDAERAIEPARMVLRLRMRADQQPRTWFSRPGENIADAVDRRVKTGRRQLLDEPGSRRHVLRRIGRPMHAGLIFPEFRQTALVGKQAFSIYFRHSSIFRRSGRFDSEDELAGNLP